MNEFKTLEEFIKHQKPLLTDDEVKEEVGQIRQVFNKLNKLLGGPDILPIDLLK